MRILHICQRDDPDTGGSLRVAEALVREQRAAGLDAWLLFLYGPPSHIAKGFGSNVVCLGLKSSKQALRGISLLHSTIKEINPTIIHSHDGIIWPRISYLRLRIPVVMHAHLPATGYGGGIRHHLGLTLVKKTTTAIIGISRHTGGTWKQAGYSSDHIHLIPNGVDTDRFHPLDQAARQALRKELGLPRDRRILLWVGRLHQSMKGSDRVERIAGMLPDDVLLVVVGQGPDYEGMLDRCKPIIDAGNLIMAGSASVPENYYKVADAFLFTSYHEPFGLVILEAAACGLPLLAFPVTGGGGAVELIQEFDATMVQDDDSKETVSQAIETVFEKRKYSADLRKKTIQSYTWAPLSRQLTKVYESLVEVAVPRILQVCQRDDMRTGGATRIACDLVLGQNQYGARVSLMFLYGEPGNLGKSLPGGSSIYLGLSSAAEVVAKGWRIARAIKQFKPDIIHHHDMLLWPQFMHLFPHRYKVVYHAHLDFRTERSLKGRIGFWLVKHNSDMVVTPSNYGRQKLLDVHVPAESVSVIPNGTRIPLASGKGSAVDALRKKYGIPPDRIVIGWGGRLHCDTKGTDDFIRLLRFLPAEYLGIVAGQGPDEQMVKKMVTSAGLSDRVLFLGLERNMESFYQGLDGFVMTSHFESFGLVVIEALANGIPVFCLPVIGGISDLLELPGIISVPERSPEALAARIMDAMSDRADVMALTRTGQRMVCERYSIERMVSETMSLYESIGGMNNIRAMTTKPAALDYAAVQAEMNEG